MAKMSVKMPDDFTMRLSNLGERTDEIVGKVLQAGGEEIQKEVKSAVSAVIGKDTKREYTSTGQLEQSVGITRAWCDRDGNQNVRITFFGTRADGTKNALIAGVLEYGKSNQKARPFIKKAKVAAQEKCMQAMEQTLDEEVSKL